MKDRFEYRAFSQCIFDNTTKYHYVGDEETTKLLNSLHEENTILKGAMAEYEEQLTNTTDITTIINEAITNERTQLGKSVLKQLLGDWNE